MRHLFVTLFGIIPARTGGFIFIFYFSKHATAEWNATQLCSTTSVKTEIHVKVSLSQVLVGILVF